jgi:hypothetical protein
MGEMETADSGAPLNVETESDAKRLSQLSSVRATEGLWSRLATPLNSDAGALFAWLAGPGVLFYLFLGNLPLALCFGAAVFFVSSAFSTRAEAQPGEAARSKAVLVACAFAAIALTTLGGEGRLLPATPDWHTRDAVLNDLVRQPWPFAYRFDGKDWLLRAPLGMYLAPAAIGKLGGLRAAHLALWVQNSIVLFILLRILSASTSAGRSLVALAVFCIFSGWDAVGARLTHFTPSASLDIEWWAGAFQYSSTMTQAFWVPNHAFPGWALAALLLLWERGQIRIGALMMGAAASILWSPFALIGAVPFLVKAGIEALRRGKVWGDVGLSLLLTVALAPLALFLVTDSSRIPHGVEPMTRPDLAAMYLLFIFIELSPAMVINAISPERRDGFSRPTYLLAIAVLLILPFYSLGPANDLVMRASIPALAVVAITTGHSAYTIWREGKGWKVAFTAVALMLGLLTGVSETWFILRSPNTGVSACDLIQEHAGPHYLAEPGDAPRWLLGHDIKVYRTSLTPGRCADQKL